MCLGEYHPGVASCAGASSAPTMVNLAGEAGDVCGWAPPSCHELHACELHSQPRRARQVKHETCAGGLLPGRPLRAAGVEYELCTVRAPLRCFLFSGTVATGKLDERIGEIIWADVAGHEPELSGGWTSCSEHYPKRISISEPAAASWSLPPRLALAARLQCHCSGGCLL